jgi:hypothetical protein
MAKVSNARLVSRQSDDTPVAAGRATRATRSQSREPPSPQQQKMRGRGANAAAPKKKPGRKPKGGVATAVGE